ncbi:hypothetical protein [Agriterribacter sp.]|uniref:hypothetical protein n=1 Tax=Agriterribacter sp. TaxID=2821509 RepID=UPI002C104AF1|nr:hypothetical protein [Agriterribacter sp.]HRP55703.1 hypothetical protein [Agriterribacter sp.]
MKIVPRIIAFLTFILCSYTLRSQDTLPDFTVVNRNGKIILSWVNDFPVIKQLSIQRSPDSMKGFKTILTLPDPSSVTNGFLDNNAPDTSSFYKLYILLDNGNYIFSKAQKPHKDLPPAVKKESRIKSNAVVRPNSPDNKNAAVTDGTPASYQLQSTARTAGKKRSDGLMADTVNMVRPETYRPSGFVFTNPDGDVTVVLPPGRLNNFKIIFYEENGSTLFRINDIKEPIFTLDKSNFMHSGWFRFELFENGLLKEKNKVRVP